MTVFCDACLAITSVLCSAYVCFFGTIPQGTCWTNQLCDEDVSETTCTCTDIVNAVGS